MNTITQEWIKANERMKAQVAERLPYKGGKYENQIA